MTQYNFEWDPEKAKLNMRKHDVSFEEAATVFHDPNSITIFDEDHTEKEERWITIGISVSGRLIIVRTKTTHLKIFCHCEAFFAEAIS